MFKKIMSIILIIIIVLSFKLLVINNFYVPKEFYWNSFDFNFKEREYFLIDDSNGLDINIYYKNKEDILKVIKKYKPKEPYKFFMFSILR